MAKGKKQKPPPKPTLLPRMFKKNTAKPVYSNASVNQIRRDLRRSRQQTRYTANARGGSTLKVLAGSTGYSRSLALAIAEPANYAAVRLPTVDVCRTSCDTLNDEYSIHSGTVSGPPGFASGDITVIFYGQPCRSALIWQSDVASAAYALQFYNVTGSGNWDMNFLMSQPISLESSVGTYWPLQAAFSQSQAAPHGQYLPVGVSSANLGYLYMNSNDVLQCVGGTIGNVTGELIMSAWVWQGRKVTPSNLGRCTVAFNAGAPSPATQTIFTAPGPGYYALSVNSVHVNSGNPTGNFEIQAQLTTAGGPGYVFYHSSDVDPTGSGDPNQLMETRVNASSILITNTTNALTAQGSVIAARMRSTDALDITPDVLSRAAEHYTGRATQGVYTFKDFSSYSEIYRACCLQANRDINVYAGPSYDLEYDDYYHFIRLTGFSTSTPNTFLVNIASTLEFKTDLTRYDKEVAFGSCLSLMDARREINLNPIWFYENPLHMKQIYQWLKGAGQSLLKGLKTAGPYAAAVGSMLNPGSSQALQAINSGLQML